MQEQHKYLVGIDVGSTTVKCVVVDESRLEIIWSDYQRHEGVQPEKLLELLTALEAAFPALGSDNCHAYITGSGGAALANKVGARFIQEVNAVTLAVEKFHPDVSSVVELGGQDAKIIIFKGEPGSSDRQVITTMNDKCASGTGATLDKCMIKVGLAPEEVIKLPFLPDKLHHVAAKCGVFAETDIVNLIKAGVPADEVMNSLADAIVMQNLTVLTRGNTLYPNVLLLGGPNTYLPFLQQGWRRRIHEVWQERGVEIPDRPMEELVRVPDNAQYYAAYGSVVFGVNDVDAEVRYRGAAGLADALSNGAQQLPKSRETTGLWKDKAELDEFLAQYRTPKFIPPELTAGSEVGGYIGIDGGSTSSKAVLLDENGDLLAKAYRLSKGNPIEDSRFLLAELRQHVENQGAKLKVLGFGVTGYAGDVLEKAMSTDANVVETIAHMQSAKRYCGEDIDVICDIGGQDIKVLFMKNGEIDHFKLSNQCSAGNGMLLQTMASQFGVPLTEFADVAFSATSSPEFSYGCAVFLDSDRVNFQKEGYKKEELFAGLARVLPKNVWQYVVQIPRLAALGTKYVLQGGTQYNLAAVKAQVDYIKQRVPNAEVIVHPHCGEGGAIGAAIEARRAVKQRGFSTFIGIAEAEVLKYTARTDESTRCNFCENLCSRTFIDIQVPKSEETVRHITGHSCEKGEAESKEQVVELTQLRRQLKVSYPNLVDYESRLLFSDFYEPEPLPEFPEVKRRWFNFKKAKPELPQNQLTAEQRAKIKVGIPRVLNVYSTAPFLRTYLQTLGLDHKNIIFSEHTSERLWEEGGKFGSIDPCFPSKVALAHVHNLITKLNAKRHFDYVWFPSMTHVPGTCSHSMDNVACPVVAGTPAVAKAAFTKEKDQFAAADLDYILDAINFDDHDILKLQLHKTWSERLGVSRVESDWACEQGLKALKKADEALQHRGEKILQEAQKNHGVVLLMIGRPYHSDPGLNHEVLDSFQSLDYPVLSIRSIPRDPEFLARVFAEDLEAGIISDPLDIRDVWPENYSVNSAQKVWAAKFAARHPNVAVIDLSSFKCGHDAPTYGLIERIMNTSKTPYFALHDIDANKPTGSINIRIRTFARSLENHRIVLKEQAVKRAQLTKELFVKRQQLLDLHGGTTSEESDLLFSRYLDEDTELAQGDAPVAANSAVNCETKRSAERQKNKQSAN